MIRVLALMLLLAAPAVADDSTTDLICDMSRLGYPPGQISDLLQQGDGRWNPYTAGLEVQSTIVFEGKCG